MSRRLVKTSDRKILGVCGALAAYTGIDVTLIRVAFLFSVIAFGTGLLLYLLLGLLIPSH
jgi:phage shock protein PspC (stress-responsive transcriptional regulator)